MGKRSYNELEHISFLPKGPSQQESISSSGLLACHWLAHRLNLTAQVVVENRITSWDKPRVNMNLMKCEHQGPMTGKEIIEEKELNLQVSTNLL